MTTGPWRPVTIDSYTSRISDLRCAIQVNEDLSAHATISFAIEGQEDGISARYRIFEASSGNKELTSGSVTLSSGQGSASFKCKSGEVKLWYPVGYGSQTLYEIEVVVVLDNGYDVGVLEAVALDEVADGLSALCKRDKQPFSNLLESGNIGGRFGLVTFLGNQINRRLQGTLLPIRAL